MGLVGKSSEISSQLLELASTSLIWSSGSLDDNSVIYFYSTNVDNTYKAGRKILTLVFYVDKMEGANML